MIIENLESGGLSGDATSVIIARVKRAKKGKGEGRPVFDSIRKPLAPPTRKFGGDKPEEKLRPSLRKVKHKKSGKFQVPGSEFQVDEF